MDKIATNNLLIALRGDVKAAKSMVAGNLVRKINELKKNLDKVPDPAKQDKANKKIETLHSEIKLLKTLDTYQVSKNAVLKSDPKYWSALVGDSKASMEDQLTGRVLSKNKIQKRVQQFKSDHKDVDEWIEEYFEFREKKRELTEVKVAKRKIKSNSDSGAPKVRSSRKKPFDKSRSSDRADGKPKFEKKGGSNQAGGARQQRSGPKPVRDHNQNQNRAQRQNQNQSRESLHPSWESKRKEKELLKAALSGKAPKSKRIVLNAG